MCYIVQYNDFILHVFTRTLSLPLWKGDRWYTTLCEYPANLFSGSVSFSIRYMWGKRDRKPYYIIKQTGPQKILTMSLNANNIILLPLQIKQGLMKSFVTAIDKAFRRLRNKLSRLSDAEVKERILYWTTYSRNCN